MKVYLGEERAYDVEVVVRMPEVTSRHVQEPGSAQRYSTAFPSSAAVW